MTFIHSEVNCQYVVCQARRFGLDRCERLFRARRASSWTFDCWWSNIAACNKTFHRVVDTDKLWPSYLAVRGKTFASFMLETLVFSDYIYIYIQDFECDSMSRFPASHDTYVCALAKTYPQLLVSTLQHVLDQLWYTPTFLYHRFVIAIAHAEESHR